MRRPRHRALSRVPNMKFCIVRGVDRTHRHPGDVSSCVALARSTAASARPPCFDAPSLLLPSLCLRTWFTHSCTLHMCPRVLRQFPMIFRHSSHSYASPALQRTHLDHHAPLSHLLLSLRSLPVLSSTGVLICSPNCSALPPSMMRIGIATGFVLTTSRIPLLLASHS